MRHRPRYALIALVLTPLALGSMVARPSFAQGARAEVDSLNAIPPETLFSDLQWGIETYGRAARLAHEIGYPAGEGRALHLQGVAYYLSGDQEQGVAVTLQAIRIFEDAGLDSELARSYGELGFAMKRRNLERATEFVRRGIAIAEAHADSTNLTTLYDHFGAIQEFHARMDSAGFYYQRALEYKIATQDSVGLPYTLRNLGGVAVQRGEFDVAEQYFEQAEIHYREQDNEFGIFLSAMSYGDLEYTREDYAASVTHFEAALELPIMQGQLYAQGYAHQRLAVCYENLGDYEQAYRHHQLFTAADDSLNGAETVARIQSLELSFETEKKDRLLAENRLEIAARDRQVAILGGSILVLVVVGIGLVRHQLVQRREAELRGKLRRAEMDQRVAEEKLRISRELHDNVGAQITFLASSLDNLSHQSDPTRVQAGLGSLREFGRNTLHELRQTVWAMREEEAGLDALAGKLQELKKQCAGTGRELEIRVEKNSNGQKLSSHTMLSLLRICQEAVQNTLKHTQEGPIEIELNLGLDALRLLVVDRGPGFDLDEVQHVGGLSNMRQRVTELGGTIDIRSGGEGTQIDCTIPVN